MTKFTQTLLILPLVIITTVGCKSRTDIMTVPHPLDPSEEVTVNCKDRSLLHRGIWLNHDDMVREYGSGFGDVHNHFMGHICD